MPESSRSPEVPTPKDPREELVKTLVDHIECSTTLWEKGWDAGERQAPSQDAIPCAMTP